MKIFLFLLPLVCLFSSCQREEARPSVIRPVQWKKMASSPAAQKRIFSGVARARVESKLSFRIPGRLEQLLVHVGQTVHEGEPLAQLDRRDVLLQVEESEAVVLQSSAQKKKAASDYSRTRELYEMENASRADLDAARAHFESASALLDAAQTKLSLALIQLGYTALAAPYHGIVAEVPVEVHENVRAGETIVHLFSNDRLEVASSIPEMLIEKIHRGDPVLCSFDALPGKTFSGTITEVGGISSLGVTFPIAAQLNDWVPNLRPGMSAELQLSFPQECDPEVLFVPPQSILEREGKRYIFIAVPQKDSLAKVERKEVVIGPLTSEGVQILSGLCQGDCLITAGVHFLQEGETVRLQHEKDR